MDIALGISDPRQQIGQISDEFGVTADDDGSGLAKDQHDWAPKSWFKGKSREETRGKTPPIIEPIPLTTGKHKNNYFTIADYHLEYYKLFE